MAVVHYKFKNSNDYDSLTFDGLAVSLRDLKQGILRKKKMKAEDTDLQVINAQTGEEYSSPSIMIPKNTSLVIARIPVGGSSRKTEDLTPQTKAKKCSAFRKETQANTITFPPGLVPGPGAVLMKNEHGQIVLVQQGARAGQLNVSSVAISTSNTPHKVQYVRHPTANTAQRLPTGQIVHIQHGAPSPTPTAVRQAMPSPVNAVRTQLAVRVAAPQGGMQTVMRTSTPTAGSQAAAAANAQQQAMIDNVKKCKNFLSTLSKLAASQPEATVSSVRDLIQGLIDGKLEPELFTERLQKEFKTSPKPDLVPFLKKSLPLLRQSLLNNKMSIDGVKPPPPEIVQQSLPVSVAPVPTAVSHPQQGQGDHVPTVVNGIPAQPVRTVASSGGFNYFKGSPAELTVPPPALPTFPPHPGFPPPMMNPCAPPPIVDSERPIKRRHVVLDDSKIRIPLDKGWKRQTNIHSLHSYGRRGIVGEVWYFAPCGRKMKTIPDVMRYIKRNGITDLGRGHFSFNTKVNVGEFYEARVGGGENVRERVGFVKLTETEILDRLSVTVNRRMKKIENQKKREKLRLQQVMAKQIMENKMKEKLEQQVPPPVVVPSYPPPVRPTLLPPPLNLPKPLSEHEFWEEMKRQREEQSDPLLEFAKSHEKRGEKKVYSRSRSRTPRSRTRSLSPVRYRSRSRSWDRWSPRRRSYTPLCRSLTPRRSYTPVRSRYSPRRTRSRSRGYSPKRYYSPPRSRSRSRFRSYSRSPIRRRSFSRSRSRDRRRSPLRRSPSPRGRGGPPPPPFGDFRGDFMGAPPPISPVHPPDYRIGFGYPPDPHGYPGPYPPSGYPPPPAPVRDPREDPNYHGLNIDEDIVKFEQYKQMYDLYNRSYGFAPSTSMPGGHTPPQGPPPAPPGTMPLSTPPERVRAGSPLGRKSPSRRRSPPREKDRRNYDRDQDRRGSDRRRDERASKSPDRRRDERASKSPDRRRDERASKSPDRRRDEQASKSPDKKRARAQDKKRQEDRQAEDSPSPDRKRETQSEDEKESSPETKKVVKKERKKDKKARKKREKSENAEKKKKKKKDKIKSKKEKNDKKSKKPKSSDTSDDESDEPVKKKSKKHKAEESEHSDMDTQKKSETSRLDSTAQSELSENEISDNEQDVVSRKTTDTDNTNVQPEQIEQETVLSSSDNVKPEIEEVINTNKTDAESDSEVSQSDATQEPASKRRSIKRTIEDADKETVESKKVKLETDETTVDAKAEIQPMDVSYHKSPDSAEDDIPAPEHELMLDPPELSKWETEDDPYELSPKPTRVKPKWKPEKQTFLPRSVIEKAEHAISAKVMKTKHKKEKKAKKKKDKKKKKNKESKRNK